MGASFTMGAVLAAGAGRRFGAVKQLADLGGRPLLEHALAAMRDSTSRRDAVVLGAHAAAIRSAARLDGFDVLHASRWPEGMGASLRAALEHAQDADGCGAVVVTLGDQPLMSAAAIDRVLARHAATGAPAVRAAYGGRPGHPVLLTRSVWDEVLDEVTADQGARAVLARRGAVLVECADVACDADVDDPAGLERMGHLVAARDGRP